ncbi:DNA glycosylase [Trametopsis cervina]|nr:DNA glycosylase [Trametopsis cervina]
MATGASETRKSTRLRFPTYKLTSRDTTVAGSSSSVTSKYWQALPADRTAVEQDVKPSIIESAVTEEPGIHIVGNKRKRTVLEKTAAAAAPSLKVETMEFAVASGSSLPDSPSKRPAKRVKVKAKYAPPEKYGHLKYLTDYLEEDLDVVFCGINPGCRSAEVGHHFAHPTNHFWRCLHQAGLTERQLDPSEDGTLPEKYNFGMTDLVERPSSEQAELSKADLLAGVPVLLTKIRTHKPGVICFVGKQIGEVFCTEGGRLGALTEVHKLSEECSKSSTTQTKQKGKAKKKPFEWGIQPLKIVHASKMSGSSIPSPSETLIFIMPSTSARVAGYQLADKVRIVRMLYELVQRLKTTRPRASTSGSGDRAQPIAADYSFLEASMQLKEEAQDDRTILQAIVKQEADTDAHPAPLI